MPNKGIRYDEDFKKTIVALHQNGKMQASLSTWAKTAQFENNSNGAVFGL